MLSTIVAAAGLLPLAHALTYTVSKDYTEGSLFDNLQFYSDFDPTRGPTNYLDKAAAMAGGLATILDGPNGTKQYRLGVDTRPNELSVVNNKRNSVRPESLHPFGAGSLVVLDLPHMPANVCGSWPAFWSFAKDLVWPDGGEIDIIEGVNSQIGVKSVLHTKSPPKCTIPNRYGKNSKSVAPDRCDVNPPDNAGCMLSSNDPDTFGSAYKGGVWVMEFDGVSGRDTPGGKDQAGIDVKNDKSGINIWFFKYGNVPFDPSSDGPIVMNDEIWKTPIAAFPSNPANCDIGKAFKPQNLIFNVAFCGEWAGKSEVWAADSTCSQRAKTCDEFVLGNPEAFKESYFLINTLKVYKGDGTPGGSGKSGDGTSGGSGKSGDGAGNTTSLFGGNIHNKMAAAGVPKVSTQGALDMMTLTKTDVGNWTRTTSSQDRGGSSTGGVDLAGADDKDAIATRTKPASSAAAPYYSAPSDAAPPKPESTPKTSVQSTSMPTPDSVTSPVSSSSPMDTADHGQADVYQSSPKPKSACRAGGLRKRHHHHHHHHRRIEDL